MQRRQFTRLSLFLFGLGLAECSKNQVESTKGFTINRGNSLRIWWSQGKAIRTIVVDGLSVAQATNQAIAQIKQIFADWK
ncbi:MAG: hypothetical protein F6J98_27445 [Moorea sp. SIO4G2]|uniref:Uncharacterized protein n=1 Tax=Moorena bouillonii PNG TaxID=568701 RepID=A0A1U7MWX7_9CYAN|nr:hypothetical protein [Moorena bouillonii]NEO45537.1 hypothetical protein [Moorena sp. SIO4A3]NEO63959.1 hypothetical protein [Moorena sp. SIO4G2]OLT58141.1 hypothetical protein BJP37_02885 [Moorena bouillonii PNG]